MNNNLAEEYKKELLKNSKYKLLFLKLDKEKDETYGNTNESNNSNINDDNYKNSQGEFEHSDRFKNLPNLSDEKIAEYKRLDERFKEIRSANLATKADKEAEEYIANLRDIGEYNRWSLKLTQKWLMKFYNGNKF